jgi:hypothetical protein
MHLIPGGGDTDPDVWIVYTSEDGLPADSIDHIAVESEDAVWVASGNRIARCTVGE